VTPPLPGQRAAQSPLQAMTASQRALGRAAQAGAGGLAGAIGSAWVDGQRYEVDLLAAAEERTRPVLDCGCADTCRCPDGDRSANSKTITERS
jgi:hypothetical protein